jgi:hypothetical protein
LRYSFSYFYTNFTISKLLLVKFKITLFILLFSVTSYAQKLTKKQKQQADKERIEKLKAKEASGSLIFLKQSQFGISFNSDGYSLSYEKGIFKTLTKTNLWWLSFSERNHVKEEKISSLYSQQFGIGRQFIYGKQNSFLNFKVGFGKQILLGNKAAKNGVAVSLIYGGGFSLGMLRPYYLEVYDNKTQELVEVKYANTPDSIFLNPRYIVGGASFGRGFDEMKFVPGLFFKTGFRFDYGSYNETITALEVGLNAEWYSKEMPMMIDVPAKNIFISGYITLSFGGRR